MIGPAWAPHPFRGQGAVGRGTSVQLGQPLHEQGAPPDRIDDVEYVDVFRNADGLPNIARMYVQGLAFARTSSDGHRWLVCRSVTPNALPSPPGCPRRQPGRRLPR
jgi:hypothetical protein